MKRLLSVLVLCAVCLPGCNSDEEERAQKLQRKSVATDVKPLREALVSDAQLDAADRNSPERAFLEFWSLLQNQAWFAALQRYDAPLREALGSDRIVEALKSEAEYFRSVRPQLKRAVREDGRVTLPYLVKNTAGDLTSQSTTLVRTDDGWRIFYDTFLDEALRQAAQRATQVRIDPTAERIGPEAIRQGDTASRLQSRYLRLRLGQPPPG